MQQFCPGYSRDPFVSLCQDYPGAETYPPSDFQVEWGPVFHRGRLDGSARVLVLGMGPTHYELIGRRVLMGMGGCRMQGFLAKLGIVRNYVMLNTFLYVVANSRGAATFEREPGIVRYRHAWFEALVTDQIEAVVTLGARAASAWELWMATNSGRRAQAIPHVKMVHPTQPESAASGDRVRLEIARKSLLDNWNQALEILYEVVRHPDISENIKRRDFYGSQFRNNEHVEIPSGDLPAGVPIWMASDSAWAQRLGITKGEKRISIALQVPSAFQPIAMASPEQTHVK